MARIGTVLIANRGEIARRIIRTCRDLGVGTVAVFSDADRDLPFVREADRAVHLGESSAEHSYLAVDKLLEAAARTGADAVHPGYGFLAENAGFAQSVLDAGLIWIGPPPAAIDAMGDKASARKLAAQHDVPTVPGYDADDQSDAAFVAAAADIGFPLLVKAVAGGGGRGMRRVDAADQLVDALASARREAVAAFAHGDLILERYVERPRHIEVQVFGDTHGHVVHLFERECSIQRRHQKIIEEAPSPAVSSELRAALGEAACRIAAAAGYVGAGTAEFLVSGESFYFLEMNTRLQVEHPVTEEVTGLDLVALQLAVAEGQALPFSQADLSFEGHSIEARVYAEDPLRDYLPATGTLVRFDIEPGEGIRLDVGFESGSEVSPWYDAMIAKVIATGPDRATASRRLARALQRAWVPGVVTNLPLLRQILATDAWWDGDLHTGFLPEAGLPKAPPLNLADGAVAAVAHGWHTRRQATPFPGDVPLGWRVEGVAEERDSWRCGDQVLEIAWRSRTDGADLTIHGLGDAPVQRSVRVLARDGDHWRLDVDGIVATWRIATNGDLLYVHTGTGESFLALEPRFPLPKGMADEPGTLTSPTPGTVVAVHVAPGDTVTAGQALVVIEAMKMEHTVAAPEDGTVQEVRVEAGDTVDEGALLVRYEEADDA